MEALKRDKLSVEDVRDHLRSILIYIGEDPDREGLLETPERIIRSWKELYAGYGQSPEEILSKRFSETDGYDQMILLKDIGFFSVCEHHTLSFIGVAHVGYLPRDKVVGISKIARLVDCHARRLQIQERMTRSIATDIMKYVEPRGVAVVVEGQHLCMQARGVQKIGATMITSAMEGIFKDIRGGIKDEFLTLLAISR
jgi:GTP cyclohydrolase I